MGANLRKDKMTDKEKNDDKPEDLEHFFEMLTKNMGLLSLNNYLLSEKMLELDKRLSKLEEIKKNGN